MDTKVKTKMKNKGIFLMAVLLAGIASITSCRKGGVKEEYWGVAPFLKVDNTAYRIGCATGDTTILVSSNMWYDVSVTYPSGETTQWVTSYPADTTLNDTQSIRFGFAYNVTDFSRTATVTLTPSTKGPSPVDPIVFTITQSLWNIPYPDPVVTFNNDYNFLATWLPVIGSSKYIVHLTDASGGVLDTITLPGTQTSFDAAAYFASRNPIYCNKFSLQVEAWASDKINSLSTVFTHHSLFSDDNTAANVGTAAAPYLISSPRHLQNMVIDAQRRTAFYQQSSDIDFTGATKYLPVGGYNGTAATFVPFRGTYDGNGKTIKNFNYTVDEALMASGNLTVWGIFGAIAPGGTVKNLKIADSKLSLVKISTPANGPNGVGFVAGSNSGGLIDGVTTTNCTLEITTNFNAIAAGVGSIVGMNTNGALVGGTAANVGIVNHCYTNGGSVGLASGVSRTTAVASYFTGGLVGQGNVGCLIENSGNNSTVVSTNGFSGGVVGAHGSVYMSYNKAPVDGGGKAGGISGLLNQNNSKDSIVLCYNTGKLTVIWKNALVYLGGIVGHINLQQAASVYKISKCFNSGDIDYGLSPDYPHVMGGIVGYCQTNATGTANISNCYNTGNILFYFSPANPNTGTNVARGAGIVAQMDQSYTNVTACYSTGKVDIGGTAAYAARCVATGVVGNRNSSTASNKILGAYFITGTVFQMGAVTNVAIGGSGALTAPNVVDVPQTGVTEAAMRLQSTFSVTYFDFTNVWQFAAGYNYPQLRGLPHVAQGQ